MSQIQEAARQHWAQVERDRSELTRALQRMAELEQENRKLKADNAELKQAEIRK